MKPEQLLRYMSGDVFAAKLCDSLIFIGHLWDDQIDKDKIRDNQEVNTAWTMALCDIYDNPFHQAFAQEIQPLIRNVIIHWLTANNLERGTDEEKCMSYLLRNDLLSVVDYCIFITCGRDMTKTVLLSTEFRKEVAKDFQKLFSFFLAEMQEDI